MKNIEEDGRGCRSGRRGGDGPVAEHRRTSASAELVGPACSAYAEQVPTGPGSVAGMAMDPVAVAASNNPMLTTLTKAISGQLNPKVNLVDTLNGGEFTVFAPTDDAFAKIDPATIEKLKTDSDLLTKILTYHVVPGQASPTQVVGTHKTVRGRRRDGHRHGQRPQGQQRIGGVRRCLDGQRTGVHDRHRADATRELSSTTTEYGRRSPITCDRAAADGSTVASILSTRLSRIVSTMTANSRRSRRRAERALRPAR